MANVLKLEYIFQLNLMVQLQVLIFENPSLIYPFYVNIF